MIKAKSLGVSALAAAVLGLASISASADVAVDAMDRGWYLDNPFSGKVESYEGVTNYLVGMGIISIPDSLRGEYRNYFVFDLTAYAGQSFTEATLNLYNPKYGDPGTLEANPNHYGGFGQNGGNALPYETYELHEVTTDVLAIMNRTAGRGGFDDLGDGTVFGSYDASLADNGEFIRIVLNGMGLEAINAALGGYFVIGGSVTTLAGDTGSQTIFGFTNTGKFSDTQLILGNPLQEVPEPGTLLLFGAGFLGLALARGRYKKA